MILRMFKWFLFIHKLADSKLYAVWIEGKMVAYNFSVNDFHRSRCSALHPTDKLSVFRIVSGLNDQCILYDH